MPESVHVKRENLSASSRCLLVFISAFLVTCALLSLGAIEKSGWPYHIVSVASYSLIYFLPIELLALLIGVLFFWRKGGSTSVFADPTNWSFVIGITLVELLLFGDLWLFSHYGFHINGFVLNLATTPGGVESLGASKSSNVTIFAMVVALLALNTFLLFAGIKILERYHILRSFTKFRYLTAMFLGLFVVQGLAYGYLSFKGSTLNYSVQNTIPGFQTITYRSALKSMGIAEVVAQTSAYVGSGKDKNNLYYPQNPIGFNPKATPYNIVWLVSESLRADMLTPRIMPNTFAFAEQSYQFKNHYSGGNGTRIGMFTMFYGLYGSYWFDFLQSQRPPVFFNYVQERDYQLSMYTSARFSYPEFDKTIFASIDKKDLHEYEIGEGWERDTKNVTDMLKFIGQRDPEKPFMTFMFFESPHARYYFPKDAVIEPDYLEDFNYFTMDTQTDMIKIKNRYINSVHYLDSQFGRVIDSLQENNLLANTIVIITGDHGEEFMENGRWGHNSAFTEEQIRVPLVLHVPGSTPQTITHTTNHIDIIPTLLPLLGVTNEVEDYALGQSLLSTMSAPFMVLSDWDSNAILTGRFKQTLPVKTQGFMRKNQITTPDDKEIVDFEKNAAYQAVLMSALENSQHFYNRSPLGDSHLARQAINE